MPKNNISYEMARIGELNRLELIQEYQKIFGREPPGSISQGLLRNYICYELRLRSMGDMPAELKKLITQAIKDEAPKRRLWDQQTQFKPGTRFRRLWKGQSYEVVVEGNRFRLGDQSCKSLSEAARLITGTRWNGHLFFGLKATKTKESKHAAA